MKDYDFSFGIFFINELIIKGYEIFYMKFMNYIHIILLIDEITIFLEIVSEKSFRLLVKLC